MPAADPLLRPGLLEGRVVVTHGPVEDLAPRLRALGARAFELEADPADEEGAAASAASLLNWHGRIDALVLEAPAAARDVDALRARLDEMWTAIRAVANAAFIPGDRGGKVIAVAPSPGEGPRAHAARAAVENMARTLSIEWSRHGVRTAAIRPGDATSPEEVSGLVAYLASPAGDYFSGCAFTLGLQRPAPAA